MSTYAARVVCVSCSLHDRYVLLTSDFCLRFRELYAVAIKELIFTTISGVVAVCFVGFVVIPHWTAVLFVGPMIVMVYFDLLGVMQFCGIHINGKRLAYFIVFFGYNT